MKTHKILIVDDELEHLEAIIDIIEEFDKPYSILQAFNGKDALKISELEIPDLIITDWEMPGMSGIELIKQMKSNGLTRDIPIIMCTGKMTSSENLETALNAGAIDFVRKPVDKIELIARIKANLHLADSYLRIKKLNESKDRFFSILAHDLKSPVGTIKVFLELILSQEYNFDREKLFGYLAMIGKQSAAVYSILDNLLVWANSQRNNIDFEPKKQPLNDAISNNIVLLENSSVKKNIIISNEIEDGLILDYDLPLISTVIRNLLANAIKFTPENGKIVMKAVQDEKQTLFSIQDSGIGIHPDRIEKLFDETIFETTLGTSEERGSGLGLKICKYFIEQHSGKIWVETEVGKGSTFKFSLPANFD